MLEARESHFRDVVRRDLILLLSGAMTAAPVLRAQQKTMPVIGWLHSLTADQSAR